MVVGICGRTFIIRVYNINMQGKRRKNVHNFPFLYRNLDKKTGMSIIGAPLKAQKTRCHIKKLGVASNLRRTEP